MNSFGLKKTFSVRDIKTKKMGMSVATALTFIGFNKAYALFRVEKAFWLSGAVLFLFLFGTNLQAKDWRGITPLKSTRTDVERLLGKEIQGSYEFSDERASIRYSQGPCEGPYRPLRRDYCACLVPKDTVMSIHVNPRVYKKFSPLQFDRTMYRREKSRPDKPEFIYSNSEEGVTYTVDESRDRLVAVDYTACAKDCQEVSKTRGLAQNSWRDLVPLHSTRADVDRLLGSPTFADLSVGGYKTKSEGVMVRYVKQSCSSGGGWNVPLDTVLEIRVTPMITLQLDQLDLDLNKYSRAESTHPENVIYYLNPDDGVMIQTTLRGEIETLTSITYGQAARDKELRCSSSPKK